MCASARESRTWRSALRAQQRSACSGKTKSTSRKSTIICGSERLNASLRCGSSSTCGVPAVNLYRLSPQGKRRFAVSVAYYCCFFLIHCLPAVLPQNLQQQQQLQPKYFAGTPDSLKENNQQHQQRLSTLFSGASSLPVFKRAASGSVPPAAAGGEAAARGPAPKNEVLLAPAEAIFHVHGAASGRPSRAGPTGRHVASNTLDMKPEKQQLAENSRTSWEQQRQGTRNDRGEERIKQKEEGRENGGPRGGDTGPMTRLQQLRVQESSDQQKQTSTHTLERSSAPIPRKKYFVSKLQFWSKNSKHGDKKEEFEQSAEVEEFVQDKQGSTASPSSVQTSATAVTSAAHHRAAGSVEELPKSAAVVRDSLCLSGAATQAEIRACAEGRTANCRSIGASPGRVHARTAAAVFGIGAPQRKDVPDAGGVNADSTSSGVLPVAAYTVRRRLAAVAESSPRFSVGNVANSPSHSSARGPGMHSELPLATGQETRAEEATETLDTREEGSENDDLFADGTLADVSKNRKVQRRRARSRGAAFEWRWKGDEGMPAAGVTRSIGTVERAQSPAQLYEEVARQQQWNTYPRPPGSDVWTTKSIDLEGGRKSGSNTGGDSVFVSRDDDRAVGSSGAVRSSLGGPRGNRFSRLLAGVEAAKGTYSTSTLDSSTTSVPSPQSQWRVPPGADPLEHIPLSGTSRSLSDFERGESAPRDRVSSVTKGRRLRGRVEQLLALNDVVDAAVEAKAESASGTRNGRVPALSPQLTTPVHSVIDLGVASEGGSDASAGEMQSLYQPDASRWQPQLKEDSQTEPVEPTSGLLEPNHMPPPVQEAEGTGTEGARWPAQGSDQATEDSLGIQQLLRRKYIDKPLGKRQRVAIVVEAVLTMLSAWVFTRLTVSLMHSTNPSTSVPFLLAKAFAVVWLGRKILANLGLVGSAIQLLVQDIFLRKKRQQLLAIADALRTLQEEEKLMQPYT